jgi:hypothetical protein
LYLSSSWKSTPRRAQTAREATRWGIGRVDVIEKGGGSEAVAIELAGSFGWE